VCCCLDAWTRSLAEAKRRGLPFEFAWGQAISRHRPHSRGYIHWGGERPHPLRPDLDEPLLAFAKRAYRAAYDDEPVLMSALMDLNGLEAA
jgi:hypothetical protein